MTYALDTNILTLFLKEEESAYKNANAALDNGHKFIIPQMADYEIRRGLLAKGMRKKLREYMELRQNVPVGVFDENVWGKAIHIYASLSQNGKPIEDADILIAAYCLANSYCLITRNIKHFERIDGLLIEEW